MRWPNDFTWVCRFLLGKSAELDFRFATLRCVREEILIRHLHCALLALRAGVLPAGALPTCALPTRTLAAHALPAAP